MEQIHRTYDDEANKSRNNWLLPSGPWNSDCSCARPMEYLIPDNVISASASIKAIAIRQSRKGISVTNPMFFGIQNSG